ncbi:cytochrome b5-like heme/steroid binding domain-containing protein [Papiliotrema laurentii]|uniref:Cytochrome b5-like heme/steroid binding domain-containing protein n=1 Tax=Papiliotrema laurentii TaxID=5418 RepID=A0AAD9CSJ0_PAPLA|nr:cytochrome b5-like heme/steroid binding domain-containing protein [Papiliotrema laurentii]
MASQLPVEKPATANGEGSESGVYTLDSLKAHSTRESFWMLLHDKVYDVTQFLDEHPGGDEVMLEEAGKDATEAFEDVGHSDEARAMLKKMLVGEFKGEKSGKAAPKAVKTASESTSASGGFPLWVVPAAVFAAYIAWRVLLA